jgi:predicted AAA+ superfamily ATPase
MLETQIRLTVEHSPSVALVGPRQVSKTTIVTPVCFVTYGLKF